MYDVHTFHEDILATLKQAGATFEPDLDVLLSRPREALHKCSCGRAFTTSQGLALHRRRAHQVHAPEYAFTAGATCPVCMKFCWTSNRLAMHLAYIPRRGGANPCFAALTKHGYSAEHCRQEAPGERRQAVRMDALQAEGPLMQFGNQWTQRMNDVAEEIAALETRLQIPEVPFDHIEYGMRLGDALTVTTRKWSAAFCSRGSGEIPDVIDCWIRLLSVFGNDFDDWAAHIFIQWGQDILPDIIAEQMDGYVEEILDQKFAECAELFPRTELASRLAQLHQRYKGLQEAAEAPSVPHRPVRRGTANPRERQATQQKVPSAFYDQVEWQAAWRKLKWFDFMKKREIPMLPGDSGCPTFLVVHLFSGRRREGDFHCHMQRQAASLGVKFVILSMDTAISPTWGDLWHTSESWAMLERLYAWGMVAMTMVGSPCETFTEARYTQPPEGEQGKWPRPLRSREWIFGLPDLTVRELRQAHAGSNFFLQGLKALCGHLVHGGLYLSEHPAMPAELERPSIWRASATELLRQHGDVRYSQVSQWQWGAEAVKPTGLLSHCLPRLMRSMYAEVDAEAVKPTTPAIGKDGSGAFRTAKLKEYPNRFCSALARAFCDQLHEEVRKGQTRQAEAWANFPGGSAVQKWLQGASEAGRSISTEARWLPDFQPRHS